MKDISEAIQQEVQKINTQPDEKVDSSIVKKIGLEVAKDKTKDPKQKINSKNLSKRFHSKKSGFLYQFKYSPTEKQEKQSYDSYPLILVLEFQGREIFCVNLHLLPLMQRSVFVFMMMKNMQKTKEGYAKIKINTLLSNKTILKYILASKQNLKISNIKSSILPIMSDTIVESCFERTKFVGITESKVHKITKMRINQK